MHLVACFAEGKPVKKSLMELVPECTSQIKAEIPTLDKIEESTKSISELIEICMTVDKQLIEVDDLSSG